MESQSTGRKLSKSTSGLRMIPVSDTYASPFALSEPMWTPDKEVTCCSSCEKQFDFFTRKHHCRRCGNCYCDRCCHHVLPLQRMYFIDPVRHCYDCAVISKMEVDFFDKTLKTLIAGSDFAISDNISCETLGKYKCHLSIDFRFLQFHTFKSNHSHDERSPPRVSLAKTTKVEFNTYEDGGEKIPTGFTIKFKDEEDSVVLHELTLVSIDKKGSISWLAALQKAFKMLFETREHTA